MTAGERRQYEATVNNLEAHGLQHSLAGFYGAVRDWAQEQEKPRPGSWEADELRLARKVLVCLDLACAIADSPVSEEGKQ